MKALLFKEIRSFLNSLIGYVTVAIFLLATGLFMWVFPGTENIFEGGIATLDSLFFNAPIVFLFLIPAITMRSFAEEKRTGTIELLFTKPLTDLQIIFAKYLAGIALVTIALLPTLIYLISIYQMGDPVGNLDLGATWGAYIGLFLLGAAFVAIGIFASACTTNQVISFLLAFILCFLFYLGFEYMGNYDWWGSLDTTILGMGIYDHYSSISRGVVDTRDLLYFFSLIAVFIVCTRLVLQSRKW